MWLKWKRAHPSKMTEGEVNDGRLREDCKPDVAEIDPALSNNNTLFLKRLEDNYYDFVDLGTCDGGGFEIAAREGGKRGLGFDLEPGAVRRSLANGLDVAFYDVCALRAATPCVDFAVCSHILEHLPDIESVQTVLSALPALCRDYILISGPCFEEEDYLRSLGLKLLHSIQADHTCKFKVIDLITLLHGLRLRDYVIALTEPIKGSDNHWIYNADEPWPPNGLWTYESGKHLPKSAVVFDRPIHRDIVCIVPLRPGIDTGAILDRFMWGYDRVVTRSSWTYAE